MCPLEDISAHADIQQQPHPRHHGQDGRAPVAHEGKRNSHHWHYAQGHADVNDHMPENQGDDAKGGNGSKSILREDANIQSPRDEEKEEPQEDEPAYESPLFSQDREDEIGVLGRDKVEFALRTIEKALSQDPSRADGDLGLDNVISSPEGIELRPEEGEDPFFLIRHEEIPHKWKDRDASDEHDYQGFPLDLDEEDNGEADKQEADRCAQIGLSRYHQGRGQ